VRCAEWRRFYISGDGAETLALTAKFAKSIREEREDEPTPSKIYAGLSLSRCG
jgi:hypothetical protein